VKKVGKQMKRERKMREPMERELMKTLSQRLQQIPPSVSRAFRDYRYAFRSWLHAAASQLFPAPAPVRIVNRQQNQSPIRRRFHR
jgi:hypothetical protein